MVATAPLCLPGPTWKWPDYLVSIDVEKGLGVHIEPNVWLSHSLVSN